MNQSARDGPFWKGKRTMPQALPREIQVEDGLFSARNFENLSKPIATILDMLTEGVFVCNSVGKIVLYQSGQLLVLGVSGGKIPGQKCPDAGG